MYTLLNFNINNKSQLLYALRMSIILPRLLFRGVINFCVQNKYKTILALINVNVQYDGFNRE